MSQSASRRNDQKFGRVEGVPEDEPCFVLRAKDWCAIEAMAAYQQACIRNGSPQDHILAIGVQVQRFAKWQGEHLDRMKVPD